MRQLRDFGDGRGSHGCYDQLCDPVPRGDAVFGRTIGVEQEHTDLTAVARVDQARGIYKRDPVSRSEPRSRQHEPCVPGGDFEGDPGADFSARARRKRDAFQRAQIKPGIVRMSARG